MKRQSTGVEARAATESHSPGKPFEFSVPQIVFPTHDSIFHYTYFIAFSGFAVSRDPPCAVP